jgi:nucleoside-diphosphate-sugar epimerase
MIFLTGANGHLGANLLRRLLRGGHRVRVFLRPGEVDLLNLANELTVFNASRCLVGQEFRKNLSAEKRDTAFAMQAILGAWRRAFRRCIRSPASDVVHR